jgi:hypothetical protein
VDKRAYLGDVALILQLSTPSLWITLYLTQIPNIWQLSSR